MSEYRIKESNPYTYEIEVLKVSYKGFWFWRTEIKEWVSSDILGRPYDEKFPKLAPIKYRDYARLQVKKFKGEIEPEKRFIIHD